MTSLMPCSGVKGEEMHCRYQGVLIAMSQEKAARIAVMNASLMNLFAKGVAFVGIQDFRSIVLK
jgi:hypothetical protein